MNRLVQGLMVVVLGAALLSAAYGDQFEIKPYISVRGEYNDNIFFNPDDEVDDYILTIAPGIVLSNRTERLNARLNGRVAPFFYQDNSDLDEVDQDYRGRINYQFTPRFFGGADAFYIVDHRIERDLLATGLVQNADRRDRYHVGGVMGYNFTELTSGGISVDLNRDDWDREANREDVDYNQVIFSLNHNLSKWLRSTGSRLQLEYGNVDRDSSNTDSFAATAGVNYKISELFRFRMRGGARYASSDFRVRGSEGRESNTGWGGVGSVILGYNGERARSDLLFSRDLSPGSGRGTPTVLTRLVGSSSYRIFENLRVGLRAGIYRNKADSGDFGTEEIDQYTFRIRPDIRWRFYDNFTLTGAYSYTYLDNQVTNRDTDRNTVFLQLAYGLPLFDFFDLSGSELRQVVTDALPPPEPR